MEQPLNFPDTEGNTATLVARPADESGTETGRTASWNPATKVAFRFSVAYLALLVLTEVRVVYSLLGLFDPISRRRREYGNTTS